MNVWAFGSRERADCIGFRQQSSVLIEVKVSRADFMADRKKPERVSGGFGNYRFYLVPAGLLDVSDLPKGWGLLEYQRKVELVHGPSGNLWPSEKNAIGTGWQEYIHVSCPIAERSFLYTLARKQL